MTGFFKKTLSDVTKSVDEKTEDKDKGPSARAPKSVNEQYSERMQQTNEKLDVKAGESARQGIIQMIERGINGKYFKEARLEPFFE